jgi:hypothetical protein
MFQDWNTLVLCKVSDFDHKASRKFNTLVETIGKRHPAFIEEEEKDEEAQPPPRPYGSKSLQHGK